MGSGPEKGGLYSVPDKRRSDEDKLRRIEETFHSHTVTWWKHCADFYAQPSFDSLLHTNLTPYSTSWGSNISRQVLFSLSVKITWSETMLWSLSDQPTHLPLRSSKMRMPRDQQSADASWPLFKMISGATYSGVPQKVQVFFPNPTFLAKPKSTLSSIWQWL